MNALLDAGADVITTDAVMRNRRDVMFDRCLCICAVHCTTFAVIGECDLSRTVCFVM